MLNLNSQVVTLSWEEVADMVADIGRILPSSTICVSPSDQDSRILALMVAEVVGAECYESGGYKIGITSLSDPDICLYEYEYENHDRPSFKGKSINKFIVPPEEKTPQVIPPWKRL